jgi:hypothetical protein
MGFFGSGYRGRPPHDPYDDDLPRIRDGKPTRRETEYIAKKELLQAYRRIEECREGMKDAVTEIGELTEEFPFLGELWKSFVKLGGISSKELEKHLDGKIIRARHQRTKKHLRLVSDRPIKPIMIKRRHRDGDDVA